MSYVKTAALAAFLFGCTTTSWAGPVTYTFSQAGFGGGASVSGLFRGTDLNNDGVLYAVGGAWVGSGLPAGNELDYMEVTLTGFPATGGPVTLVYDKAVADVNTPENVFKGFAFNLGGDVIGDEAAEGISFAFPVDGPNFPGLPQSTFNYVMGEAFAFGWAPPTLGQALTSCGDPVAPCGVVFEAVSANNPFGFAPQNEVYSSGEVATARVALPGVMGLMLGGFGALGVVARRSRTARR